MPGGEPGTPFDEDRTLHFRQNAEYRPGRNLGLGDEGSGQQRAKDRDVEIGAVIADEKRRAILGHGSPLDDNEPDHAAKDTMIEHGDTLGEPQPQ